MSILSLSTLSSNISKLSSGALNTVSVKLGLLPVEPPKKSLFSNDFSNDFFTGPALSSGYSDGFNSDF